MRAALRARGAVGQAVQPFYLEAFQPLVRRAHAHAGGVGGFFDTQALHEDAVHQQGSTARAKTGMFMQVHPGLLEGWLIRTSSLTGSPRMNNLLRDHI